MGLKIENFTADLTASHRSRLLHAAASPLGSLTPAEAPLIEAEKLFRQPAPALFCVPRFDLCQSVKSFIVR